MYNIIIKCIIYLCKCAREAAIYGFNFLCKLFGIGTDTNNILDGILRPNYTGYGNVLGINKSLKNIYM